MNFMKHIKLALTIMFVVFLVVLLMKEPIVKYDTCGSYPIMHDPNYIGQLVYVLIVE